MDYLSPPGGCTIVQLPNFGSEMAAPRKSGKDAQNAKIEEFHENWEISSNLVKFSTISSIPRKCPPKRPIFHGTRSRFCAGAPFPLILVKICKNMK